MRPYQEYTDEQIQQAIRLLSGDSFCRHIRRNLELELIARAQDAGAVGEEFEEEFRN